MDDVTLDVDDITHDVDDITHYVDDATLAVDDATLAVDDVTLAVDDITHDVDLSHIFYLTLILLWLFQQHYCYNVTGQSQESEWSYKPARIKEVHSKLHSLQASLCTLTATHLTLIYVCTYIRLWRFSVNKRPEICFPVSLPDNRQALPQSKWSFGHDAKSQKLGSQFLFDKWTPKSKLKLVLD